MEALGRWPGFCTSNSPWHSCKPDHSANRGNNPQHCCYNVAYHTPQANHVCGAHWHRQIQLHHCEWVPYDDHSV